MSLKDLGIVAVILYVMWAVIFWGSTFTRLGMNSYRTHQYQEARKHKLREDAVEQQLRQANVFGEVAHANRVMCAPDGPTNPWDYTCRLYYRIGETASIPKRKFGVMVDATHVTQMSALYPEDAAVQIPDPRH